MNLERLKKQLIEDEGCVLEVYLDHLGNPTFGIGHLLTKDDPEYYPYKNLKKGGKLKVSKERVDEVFKKDIENVCKDCVRLFINFNQMPDELKEIIANMMFNLGYSRLSKFNNFIAAIKSSNFKLAAKEMKDSAWYNQVGKRAQRLVDRMEKLANLLLCTYESSEQAKMPK